MARIHRGSATHKDGKDEALVNYQTISLSKGKHPSPEHGACVMELASMLAGESFTDHPDSVCPVVGSFLRAYNDSVDDERRQDLYRYASATVGSRRSEAIHRARADHLARWVSDMLPKRFWRSLLPSFASVVSGVSTSQFETVGAWAVRSIRKHTDHTHRAALRLVDELLAMGYTTDATAPLRQDGPVASARVGSARLAVSISPDQAA